MGENTIYQEVRISVSKEAGFDLVQILDESENKIEGLLGYYEVLYDETKDVSDETSIVLYFSSSDNLGFVKANILLSLINDPKAKIESKDVDRDTYLEEYKKYYTSFPIGDRFQIVPSWEKQTTRVESRIPIYLDPGLAFGTGQHATTQLCLSYLANRPPSSVLDAGCGSGILLIGAMLLGSKNNLAFDIDENAVFATLENLKGNSLATDQTQVMTGGFDLPQVRDWEGDLFIGNLTPVVLQSHRNDILNINAQRYVFSGIVEENEKEILQTFQDLKVIGSQMADGWLLLEMTK